MDKYEYSEKWDECTYWLSSIESCKRCLFETLCRLEWNDIHGQEKTTEKD